MSLNYLGSLIGTEVKVNRGGPDSIVGRLLSVHHDYLVIQMKDGTVVFIQLQHIKSISSTNGSVSRSYRAPQRFDRAHNFEGLLGQLRYTFVQINRGGPEKIEGLVVEAWNNFLLLVVKDEIIRIPIFHIKSINAVNKNNSNGNNNNSNGNKNNSNGNKNNSNGNKNNSNGNKNNSNGNKNNSKANKTNSNKSNRATASQIVAVKLLLKKYRAR